MKETFTSYILKGLRIRECFECTWVCCVCLVYFSVVVEVELKSFAIKVLHLSWFLLLNNVVSAINICSLPIREASKIAKDNANTMEIKELENNTIIRHLEIHEEEKWISMVSSCYATKGTPSDVFRSHLERTPRDERILLAIMDKG